MNNTEWITDEGEELVAEIELQLTMEQYEHLMTVLEQDIKRERLTAPHKGSAFAHRKAKHRARLSESILEQINDQF